ncbi:hypothetical protein SCHPADRAFT_722160 [Schizopora paradoxa]|uniref:Fungal calcium binding protein domain-containing protein n=1 Tax=Schizopora paradoxa TaxID=27342 RepID=A0A0H2R7S8_9AGAM|nr:hypothetical protein SCHPADRAFT_722160 [Schizopora paradoxa]
MKTAIASFLPFVVLAVLQLSKAGTVSPRQEPSIPGVPKIPGGEGGEGGEGCELTDLAKCVVALGTLPLPISACASAVSELSKLNTTDFNLGETIGEGADCLAEASHALQELPESCGGCAKALLQGGEGEGGEEGGESFGSFE